MRHALKDIRIAMRQFRRQPRLPLAIVSTLGLAIGMNVAVFSVVHAVMFRALPFSAPDRIVWIASVRPDNPAAPFTLPEFMDYRAQTRTLSGIAAFANWSASLDVHGATERLQGARLSANSFEVLGVSAAAGRLFRASDDEAGAPPVALLSYGLWQRQFGGAANVIGRPLRVNGEPILVVGVLPRYFPLPLQGIDVVVPLSPERDPLRFLRGSVNFLRLFGRLGDGVTTQQAEAELTAICRLLRQQFPREYARKESVRVSPFQEALIGDVRQPMLALLAAVVVVLGAALANLASLVIVRANDRRGELAVRLALGASRVGLVRQLTIEAALLAVAGALVGWLLALWATAAIGPLLPSSIPRVAEVRVDGAVLLFAFALTVVATVLLSVAPLGAIARSDATDGMLLRTRGAVGDRWSQRARQALVVAEIATALVLLLATTILVANMSQLHRVKTGFDADHVFQARVSIPPAYRTVEGIVRFHERLSARVAPLPGVQHVGVTSAAPLSGLLRTVPFGIVGGGHDERDMPSANYRVITPDYLAAVGTRLLHGRPLSENDRPDSSAVALVSAALADRFLSPDPVGRHILINDNSTGPRPIEVVGVVDDVRQTALDTPPTFDIYVPLRQVHPDNLAIARDNQFWMVKLATSPSAFRDRFLTELRAVDPDAAISNAGDFRTFVDASFGPRRFSLALFTAFSCTGLLLAISGVYALVSYTVSQRRREIGLRMAIGATERDVHRLIIGQAGRLVGVGVAIGVSLAIAARPLVSWLARGAAIDPWLGVASAGLLAAIAIAAAWLPARRATRIQPTLALQGD